MKLKFILLSTLIVLFCTASCKEIQKENPKTATTTTVKKADSRIKLILDTDANNELDDQFAIAYMLLNGDVFDVKGITVNATKADPNIQGHYNEAERVMQLCNLKDSLPLLKGVEGNFKAIAENFNPADYDGRDGVDFMLSETKKDAVIIVAVGKLTNIALAIKKDPSFVKRTKIIWLGSNYPEPGEYNQDNDTIAMNYVLNSKIPFEMVTVRYGKPTGTSAVGVTKTEVEEKMAGIGPKAKVAITGRHGGSFDNFGDYAANLFEHIFDHIKTSKVTPSRSLFDMAALAVLKNAAWGETKSIPCPILINNKWIERPNNERKIKLWENFNRDAIIADFYKTMKNPILVESSK